MGHSGMAACESGREAEKMRTTSPQALSHEPHGLPDEVQLFVGEWDAEGVFVYQAFNDDIADFALAHQQLDGPSFKTARGTWIKPSFAWMLYRSGYGRKHSQTRILKIKISHETLGQILSQCKCIDTNKVTRKTAKKDEDVSNSCIQWDPERDLMSADGKEPRMLRRRKAIQICVKGKLSDLYVKNIISIQDVTSLAHRIYEAHMSKKGDAMSELIADLPVERPYMPQCPNHRLVELGMMPGEMAAALLHSGKGKAL